MITKENERMSVGGGFLSVEEFYGLSTDTKPTNTANGSTFFEMDTGKMYRFNYSGTTWTETTHYGSDGFGPAPSGGGGGSSGGGVLVVNFDQQTMALDKTWQEIVDAEYAVIVRSVGTTTVYQYLANIQKTGDTSYVVNAFIIMGTTIYESNYIATSAEGYPVFNQG